MKSDLQIKQDIIEELSFDPAVNAAGVGVGVSDGIVTLSGRVSTLGDKIAAKRAVQKIVGVKAVAIDLEVVLGKDHVRDDTEIAKAVQRALVWNTVVPSDRVQIVVEDGMVTLSGDVDWPHQRKAATKSVNHLLGVRGIANQITIKPRVSTVNVGAQIEAALKRQAEREANRIEVLVDGGVVTLRGKVRTVAEEKAAVGAAYNATGVCSVIDELSVG